EPLEVGHAVRDVLWRRRHELGVPGTSATDPNLAGPELSGPLFGTATLSEQNSMDLANQAARERESLTQAGQAVVERCDVGRDFDDVVERDAGRFLQLEQEQVRERRLRALDLARDDRLTADVGVEEQVRLRQERGDRVEPAAGEEGLVVQPLAIR